MTIYILEMYHSIDDVFVFLSYIIKIPTIFFKNSAVSGGRSPTDIFPPTNSMKI